jgi:hypothetical protein
VGSTPRRFRHVLPSNINVFPGIRPGLRLSVPLSGLLKLPENATDRRGARARKWQCATFFLNVSLYACTPIINRILSPCQQQPRCSLRECKQMAKVIIRRESSKSRLARERAYGPPSAMRRRTDWGLNEFPHAAALHEAQAAECAAGNWPEAGAMGLRFALADYIQTGNEVDAARLTRQLVRHLRANGRIVEAK